MRRRRAGADRRLDVRTDDASGGPTSVERSKVHPEIAGDLPRKRRGLDPFARASGRGLRLGGASGARGGGSADGRGRGGCTGWGLWLNRSRGGTGIAIEHCENRTDRGLAAGRHENLGEDTIIKCLHLHRGLVGLDFGDHVADLDRVADVLVPFDESALGHGIRELGHFDVHRHGVRGRRRGSMRHRRVISSLFPQRAGNETARGSRLRRAIRDEKTDSAPQGAIVFMVGTRPRFGLPVAVCVVDCRMVASEVVPHAFLVTA